jgi:sulfatase modifying factor 1
MRCNFFFAVVFLASLSPAPASGQSDTGGKTASEMVLVSAGTFLMGSPLIGNNPLAAYPKEETPRHKVYLDSFYIDKYEVTNGQFASFLSSAMSEKGFKDKRPKWVVIRNDLDTPEKKDWWPTEIVHENGSYRAMPGFEKYPVISVSWYAADAYCRWAGKRLPTEAEWEYAARGGLDEKKYTWGDELPTSGVIFKRRWTSNAYPAPTLEVGTYYPNGYGIFDMAGNVAEWCADWYAPDYYGRSPRDNPKGPDAGTAKVIRGGSWASDHVLLRVGFRSFGTPDKLKSGVGFRCAKDGSP